MPSKAELRERALTLGLHPSTRATVAQLEHMIRKAEPRSLDEQAVRDEILAYLRDHPDAPNSQVCRDLCVRRADLKQLLRDDQEFASDYRDARGYGNETIRNELRLRAIDGIEEPVFGTLPGRNAGTGIVGTRIVKSDRLLALMAKAHLPEYRERLEVSGPSGGGVPVEVNGGRVTGISDVLALARELGVGLAAGLRDGLDTGPARDALPAAPDVLPDPGDG